MKTQEIGWPVWQRWCAVGTALTVLTLMPSISFGGLLTHDLNQEFSGGSDPEGMSPWLKATFDDSIGGANTVQLTMDAANLVDGEFTSGWYFNVNPSLDITDFSVAYVSGQMANSATFATDAYKADGDGFFDLLFDFPPPPGDFASKFTSGETSVYNITYSGNLTVDDFDFGSVGGDKGSFTSAAHVQGIGPNDGLSGWIGSGFTPGPGPGVVPEPASVAMWGFGLFVGGVVGLRRRRAVR